MTDAQIKGLIVAALVAMAWVQFAEHPTARNLRRALRESLWLA